MGRKIRVKLKEHISKSKLNQKEFSVKSGLREATVSQMANNKYERVQLEHLLKVMDYFEITDFNEILEIVEEED